MKAYIGAAIDRYCRLAARTPGSWVKMSTQRSGKIATSVPIKPTEANETKPAVQALRRARAIRSAPMAMPTIGTEASPTANATEDTMNSSRDCLGADGRHGHRRGPDCACATDCLDR